MWYKIAAKIDLYRSIWTDSGHNHDNISVYAGFEIIRKNNAAYWTIFWKINILYRNGLIIVKCKGTRIFLIFQVETVTTTVTAITAIFILFNSWDWVDLDLKLIVWIGLRHCPPIYRIKFYIFIWCMQQLGEFWRKENGEKCWDRIRHRGKSLNFPNNNFSIVI